MLPIPLRRKVIVISYFGKLWCESRKALPIPWCV